MNNKQEYFNILKSIDGDYDDEFTEVDVISVYRQIILTDNELYELFGILSILQYKQNMLCDCYIKFMGPYSLLWKSYNIMKGIPGIICPFKFLLSSQGEMYIINILKKLQEHYTLFYLYKHKWYFCKNKGLLEFDFYCFLFYNNRLIQFVIEFDGDFHRLKPSDPRFKQYHINDIIKQYYLLQLNVYLIRVKTFLTLEEWDNLIQQMINTSRYFKYGEIKPVECLFYNRKNINKIEPGLQYFCGSVANEKINLA